ncbi:MAG: hypothetical protein NTW14_09125 [bacterium]|nr:hypothetical protein [bacterium]
MNQSLIYLMDEICAGVEIYFTGRLGSQYLKTAFLLCDDYSELISKLFLLIDNPKWTEMKANSNFKSYPDIMAEVETTTSKNNPNKLEKVRELISAMKKRRKRRNDFFHSTSLLDLSVTNRNCVEAFCDLLEYGDILFGVNWRTTLEGSRNLSTFDVLLRLERHSFSDPSITQKMNRVLQNWPRNIKNAKRAGVHLAEYPEDLHLRLCVTWGGNELRDKLKTLL